MAEHPPSPQSQEGHGGGTSRLIVEPRGYLLLVEPSSAVPGTGRTDPVMAVIRLKVPATADPYVLEAVLTRAICGAVKRPMTAEVTVLPSRRRKAKGRTRKYAFVALLDSSTPTDADALVRTAEKASRAAVRQRFGSTASARVRPVGAGTELLASWCSVRGTPHRMHP